MGHQKLVVTGGAGLVGQNLLVNLAARSDLDVVVIDKHHHNLEILRKLFPTVTAIEADLAQPGTWAGHFANATTVVQLHAQIGAPTMEPFERNNVAATQNVLGAIKEHGVPYLIHASSSVVVSVADDFYTRSKRDQEALVLESGIPSVVLRPTLMFGWFDRKHLGWLSRFMKRIPFFPIPGRGHYLRQPLYVRDFVAVIESALTLRPTNEIHDITGQSRIDYVDIIRTIRRAVRARCMLVFIPVPVFGLLLRLWARFDKNPPFTDQQLQALTAGDEFADTDWPQRFNIQPTPFAKAIDETFNHPTYSDVVLEF